MENFPLNSDRLAAALSSEGYYPVRESSLHAPLTQLATKSFVPA
ncbi:hypothetical protein QUA56_26715 [Microcoleus sp. N3A4]